MAKSRRKTAKNRRKKVAKKQQNTLQIENLPVIRYFVVRRAAPRCKKILRLIVQCALSELQSCDSREVRLIVRGITYSNKTLWDVTPHPSIYLSDFDHPAKHFGKLVQEAFKYMRTINTLVS
ncbi:hypothetical protein TURU_020681 [Turdus rufiventris]|nr:hypothetical protein TURU_020681 [Turdus rufiventris]